MENNEQYDFHPIIVVEWEIWDQTWVLNRVMNYSERYGVEVSVNLQPGSMTLIIEAVTTAADVITVSLFIAALLRYLERKIKKKELPYPAINADAAVSLALSRLERFTGLRDARIRVVRRIEDGYEVELIDPNGEVHKFKVFDEETYEYARI